MTGMNEDQIAQVFGALGRIEEKIDSSKTVLADHMTDDKRVATALFERIEALQLSHAKQKGFFSALAAGGSVLGAGIGYAIEKFLGLGSH